MTDASVLQGHADGRPLLELTGIGKAFGGVRALSDVSLSVAPGEVHCLLGENGAGKSTLCNIVYGFLAPDAGEMRFQGKAYRPAGPADCLAAGVAMVHQHFSVIETMSVVDNLMLGRTTGWLRRAEFAAKVRAMSEAYGLGVEPEKLIGDMSVGERQRVEIVKCLMGEPRLLVLDEPTAVLPPQEIYTLLAICRRVAESGCGIVLVTHKLAEVAKIADRTTVLRSGSVVARASRSDMKVDALVRAMVGRDIDSLDKALTGVPADSSQQTPIFERAHAIAPGAPLALDATDLRYEDAKGVLRVDNVTLMVAPGEIVGVAGVEGNGQTELADLLAGVISPLSGRFSVAGRDVTQATPAMLAKAGVSIVPEDRHGAGCILDMTVAENLFLDRFDDFSRLGFVRRRQMLTRAAAIMREHDIRAAGPDAPMRSLSGGNQQKAILARELARDPLRFLLAAQPTRGLDIGAVEAVYRRIHAARDGGVGVLLISSELNELVAVADRIVVMYRGRIVGECRASDANREIIGTMMLGRPVAMAA